MYQDDFLYSASENEKLITYSEAAKVPYKIESNLDKLAKRGFTKNLIRELCTIYVAFNIISI